MSTNAYLEKVDKYFISMPASERIDIVKEIKSEMVELEAEGVIFQIGTYTANPILSLPISIIMGCLLILFGKKLWRFTIKIIENLSVKK